MPSVEIINASSVMSDDAIAAMIPPLQTQVSRDFAPIWGRTCKLYFVPRGQNPTAGRWWLAVLDTSDVAGALGYHDVTNTGQPLGKAFAATDLRYGKIVSVTISHELLEMLGDPNISLTVQHGDTFWAYEACDAVEADADGYEIDGVRVSNFIFPSWFESFTRQTKYDFLGQLKAPRTLRPGGYASFLRIGSTTGWQQITKTTKADVEHPMAEQLDTDGALIEQLARPPVGSRRERRRTPSGMWNRSRITLQEAA